LPLAPLPTHYFPVHQSAIRAIAWIKAPQARPGESTVTAGPYIIASGGYDGVECITDIREGQGNAMNRTRGMIPEKSLLSASTHLVPFILRCGPVHDVFAVPGWPDNSRSREYDQRIFVGTIHAGTWPHAARA
jgi:hypothetical protein